MPLRHEEESYTIRGAIFEVYGDRGSGYLEAVYQECLEMELSTRGVPFVAHPPLALRHKGQLLRQTYVPDLLCYGSILIEIKAVRALTSEHRAQVVNYLKASGLHLGFLANFGHYPGVELERFARSAQAVGQ